MKNPSHNGNYYVNLWLKPYHNITIEDVFSNEPELDSDEFFKRYPVTQQQHDEWHELAIKEAAKDNRMSKRFVKKHFWPIYLNCSPSIKP